MTISMWTARAALVGSGILLLWGGCSDADGDPSDPGPPADAGLPPDSGTPPDGGADAAVEAVAGTSTVHHVTDAGTVSVPVDLRQHEIRAWGPREGGGFTRHDGIGNEDGTFRIEGVPEGDYYLEMRPPGGGPTFTLTAERAPVVERYRLGRPDAVESGGATGLTFELTGLSPWQAEDDLVLFSTNAGAIVFSPHLNAASGAPLPGDTAISGMEVDYGSTYTGTGGPPNLIEGSKGDEAHVVQLVRGAMVEGSYFLATRHCVPAPFTMVDGQSVGLGCALAEIAPSESFAMKLDRAKFEGQAGGVHPDAVVEESEIVLRAMPGATAHGLYSGSPELIIFEAAPGAADVDATLGYGNPFPPGWDLYATYLTAFHVEVLAPGAATPGEVSTYLRNDVPLRTVGAGKVEPLITPARELRINGADASMEQAGVSATPTVTWEAPEVGSAGRYDVLVHRIYEQGGVTRRRVIARINTTVTHVTIPPEVLDAGGAYVFEVLASTGLSLPSGTAPVLSSLIRP